MWMQKPKSRCATGKQVKPIAMPELPAGNVVAVRFDPDDSHISFMLNGDTSPSDLYVMDLAAASAERLTSALNPAIDQANLVEASIVRYPSFDGTLIPSTLYKPKGASAENKSPLCWCTVARWPNPPRLPRLCAAPCEPRIRRSWRQQPRLIRLWQNLLPYG